jgi:CheY-like chemotaxis protein
VAGTNLEGLRLLLVEDEYLFAFCMAELLEDMGVDVLGPVACVSDAMDLLDKAPEIDGAILDVNLGTEVVFPVADRLLALQIPFVFASAYDRAMLPARFRGIEVCEKPLNPDVVRRAVSRLRSAA